MLQCSSSCDFSIGVQMQDDNTACHWHTEAHRHYPVNLNVTSWLGVWYVKREMYEQAIGERLCYT